MAKKPAGEAREPSRIYSHAELMEVKHLGPGMIGQEMWEQKEAYIKASDGGVLGPAMRGEANQGAPIVVPPEVA